MNKGRSILTYYTFSDSSVCAEYSVEQNNGSTSVEQKMTLTCDNVDVLSTHFNGQLWNAEIAFDDFPAQKTPEAAAHKLADWLERLAAGIRAGEYSLPSHSPVYKDMDDDNPMRSTD